MEEFGCRPRLSIVCLGSVSDSQHKYVPTGQRIDDSIVAYSEFEKSRELAVEGFTLSRVPSENRPDLFQYSLFVLRAELLQIVTNRCLVEDSTGQS
jgi:hypothetical protein